MHKSQSLFYLTTALHVSGVNITHLQEHSLDNRSGGKQRTEKQVEVEVVL
jgi:hypothetical protein